VPSSTASPRSARALTGARMPEQLVDSWLTIAPIEASRSSYNGLLVFGFITASVLLNRGRGPSIVAWGAPRPRRGTAAFPTLLQGHNIPPAASLSLCAGCSAPWCSRARDTVDMPAPGDNRAASITHSLRDPFWDTIYAPLGRVVALLAEKG